LIIHGREREKAKNIRERKREEVFKIEEKKPTCILIVVRSNLVKFLETCIYTYVQPVMTDVPQLLTRDLTYIQMNTSMHCQLYQF
jgi:hypothetical protein